MANTENNSQLKISIIIPHYNNAKYLNDCLSSIAKQSYQNFEVIIVDDCSQPEERKSAEFIAGQFAHIFLTNEKNAGVAETRNRGLAHSSGDVLTTIDPDDYYIDTCYLERVVSHFESAPSCVVGTKAVYVDQNGSLITKKITKEILIGNLKEPFFARSCYIPINIFYTSKMLEEVGGYNSMYKAYEDWDFKLRLASRFNFHIEDVEIAYRIHGHGLSSLGRLGKISKLIMVFFNNTHLLNFTEMMTVFLLLIKSLPMKFKTIIGLKKY